MIIEEVQSFMDNYLNNILSVMLKYARNPESPDIEMCIKLCNSAFELFRSRVIESGDQRLLE
ncbi:MAG: hypothetical protein LBL75_01560 [Rickettsiales bacterium]|jgi:hypothetical protein|nr:hypothetical protein [Rickettsiales bacterium]